MENKILGFLFWFSVGDLLIHHKDLKKKALQNNIDKKFIPKPIRVSDAFRRATTEVKRKRDIELDKVYQKLILAEVIATKDLINRKIIIETIDQDTMEISYENKGEIELDKNEEEFKFTSNDPYINEICNEVEQRFHLYRTHYSSTAI